MFPPGTILPVHGETCSLRFFGSSFICDHKGQILQSASEDREEVLVQELDIGEAARYRIAWNLFRERRPEMYRDLMTLDGSRVSAAV